MKQRLTAPLSKPLFTSIIFVAGLIIFEAAYLSQKEEISVISRYTARGIYLKPLFQILLSVLSVLVATFFVWAALVSPRKYRAFYFAAFSLALVTEYNFQSVFNTFTDIAATENLFLAADFGMIFSSIGGFFNPLVLAPCLAFALLLVVAKPTLKNGAGPLLAVLFLFIAFFSLSSYFTGNGYFTVSLSAFYRTAISFPVSWHLGSRRQPPQSYFNQLPRQEIEFRAPTPPVNNIVFIVDESVRGDHLSLNGYSRLTTPFLDELNQKGFIRNWGIAVAGTTCSRPSNNLLLTGVKELPDTEGKVYKLPTIFQYARAMGYKNYYFDGQVSFVWNGKKADLKDYQWVTASALSAKNPYDVDAEIAARVKEITESSAGNFIWINKRGVHPPYERNYPPERALWLPVSERSGDETSDTQALVNNYDNAIKYNSEIFFTNLFSEKSLNNTIYVYTSDHGQSLKRKGQSHCGNAKTEAMVPLFIISRPELLPPADTSFKSSHLNIFASLLDLMSVPDGERKYDYALSLFRAKASDSAPRAYCSGSSSLTSFGEKYYFDQ